MVLIVKDQITLSTRYGSSQIQLMLGDITDLPVSEKTDFVFTSAFPGDYSLVKGTLIHALYKKLGICVGVLAKNKESDLTQNFSCWISKHLAADLPYGRLVCFEVLRYQSLTEQISMMFRALMPIFSGNEYTVITPPLATGCQGAPVDTMVGVMVNTACHWIKAGLPLKCLKLVLYVNEKSPIDGQYGKTIELFQNMKMKWESEKRKRTMMKAIDISLCYHENDKKFVSEICGTFLKEDKSLTIHRDAFEMNKEISWQDDTFEIMSNSIRIVFVVTSSFVSDKWCLEQFSLAMCCNRFKGLEMVTPFYLETVEVLPSYMNLVQYHYCQDDKTGTAAEKILSACREVIKVVSMHKASEKVQETTDDMESKKSVPVYDVFISYSHSTSEIANGAVEYLSKTHPGLKVFFDKSELKTGNLWQQALYEAVDQTRCMIAILSDPYIKSTVCQEEYNLSLARRAARDDFMLVPVCLSELSTFPESYAFAKPVIVSNKEDMTQLIKKIMPEVLRLKELKERKEKGLTFINDVLQQQRYLSFSKEYQFDWTAKEVTRLKDDSTEAYLDTNTTIAFSYASDSVKFSAILSEMLQAEMPLITCKLLSFNQVEARTDIDNADMVVMFVSNEFLRSQHHVEQLHIALCRQRRIKHATILYLVETSPINEGFYYTSILPFRISMYDRFWTKFSSVFDFKVKRYSVKTKDLQGTHMCSPSEFTTLQMMNKDIIKLLSQRGYGTNIPVNLVNVIKIDKENEGKEDKDVTPEEVAVSVALFNPKKACKDRNEFDSLSEGEETEEEQQLSATSDSAQNITTFITSPYDIDTGKTDEAIKTNDVMNNDVKKDDVVDTKDDKKDDIVDTKDDKKDDVVDTKDDKKDDVVDTKDDKKDEVEHKKDASRDPADVGKPVHEVLEGDSPKKQRAKSCFLL